MLLSLCNVLLKCVTSVGDTRQVKMPGLKKADWRGCLSLRISPCAVLTRVLRMSRRRMRAREMLQEDVMVSLRVSLCRFLARTFVLLIVRQSGIAS